jgi:uncharacterized membrane protein YgcG
MTMELATLSKALWAGILIISPAQGAEQTAMSVSRLAAREPPEEQGFDLGVRLRHYYHSFIYNRNESGATTFLPPAYRNNRHSGRSDRYGVGYESRTGLDQAVGGTESGAVGTGSAGGGGGGSAGGGGPGR